MCLCVWLFKWKLHSAEGCAKIALRHTSQQNEIKSIQNGCHNKISLRLQFNFRMRASEVVFLPTFLRPNKVSLVRASYIELYEMGSYHCIVNWKTLPAIITLQQFPPIPRPILIRLTAHNKNNTWPVLEIWKEDTFEHDIYEFNGKYQFHKSKLYAFCGCHLVIIECHFRWGLFFQKMDQIVQGLQSSIFTWYSIH